MRARGLTLAVWFVAAPAAAQERPALRQEVTVDEVVSYTREHAARTRAARSEGLVADADIATAAVYPNPTASYSVYGRTQGQSDAINGSQHQLWLEQPILLGHDARRADAARGLADARRAAIDAAVFEAIIEARRRFLALLAAQERLTLLQAGRADIERVADLVRGRARAGAQSPYDVARIELEGAQLDARLASAQADVRERSAALAAWLGVVGWSPVARGAFPEDAALVSLEGLWPESQTRSRELAAAHRLTLAAAADVRRAERERWPVPTLGLGAYVTTDGSSTSVYGSVSLPIPVWDTGAAQVRRAQAMRTAAELNERAIEAELHARLEGAVAVYLERQAARSRHAERALQALPNLRAMAEASYRSGASRLFELLDALRTQLAVQEQGVELTERLEEARLAVDAAAGFGAR